MNYQDNRTSYNAVMPNRGVVQAENFLIPTAHMVGGGEDISFRGQIQTLI